MPIPSRGPTRRIAAAPLRPLLPMGVARRATGSVGGGSGLGAAAGRGRVGRD